MFKRKIGYLGFIGFIGLFGIRFFSTKDIYSLLYLTFFSFFAYFWIANIGGNLPDERYEEDVKLAKASMGNIAIVEMAALVLVGTFFPFIREYLIVGISIGLVSLILLYAVKLYNLEER